MLLDKAKDVSKDVEMVINELNTQSQSQTGKTGEGIKRTVKLIRIS